MTYVGYFVLLPSVRWWDEKLEAGKVVKKIHLTNC